MIPVTIWQKRDDNTSNRLVECVAISFLYILFSEFYIIYSENSFLYLREEFS